MEGSKMTRTAPPISLAGSQLGAIRHACAFFSNDDEEYRVLLPFIKEGLERGDRAIHVVNPQQRDEHVRRLASAGIDSAVAELTGQLEIKINTEAYLRDGKFDQDRMLETFEQLGSGNAPGRFPLSRIVCRMDWVVGDKSRLENVIEFESRANDVWSRHDDAVICTYHLSQFRGDAVIDILRTHPLVIIGGILQQNPFFTPPQEFLREYRARRSGPGSLPTQES
jgi:MEDS: MEthanogen/methylotroph, DcmR Sensory domain